MGLIISRPDRSRPSRAFLAAFLAALVPADADLRREPLRDAKLTLPLSPPAPPGSAALEPPQGGGEWEVAEENCGPMA